MSDHVFVARWEPRTEAEGPGVRFAVWVQGCSLRCPGCFNPHLWSTRGGRRLSPEELCELVPDDVEGVTLLGGEPFEQARGLARFAALVRGRGLSVMTFTGYTLDDLHDTAAAALLAQTDLLVDGRFDRDDLDLARPWVGSRNQRFHALTPRYAALLDSLADLPDRLEVRVSADGVVSVNGWATDDALEIVLEGLGRSSRIRQSGSQASRSAASASKTA